MRRLFIFGYSNITKFQKKNTEELLARGRTVFGSKEPNKEEASRFLVVLLDLVEEWSRLKRDEFSNVEFSFKNTYSKLTEKGVIFPSELKDNLKLLQFYRERKSEGLERNSRGSKVRTERSSSRAGKSSVVVESEILKIDDDKKN